MTRQKKKKDYFVKKFSVSRQILADYNDVAATFPRVRGHLEYDITKAKQRIEEIKRVDKYDISYTAWIAKCISRAVKEDLRFNSYRKGRKIIVFEKIDISIIVEITTKEGKKVPFNYVIRDVESKSVKEITEEIRAVQKRKIEETEQLTRDNSSKFSSLYLLIPRFIRKMVIKSILKNPFKLKKLIGTVGITSLGMFVQNFAGWAIPFADKTLNVAVGGMKKTVGLENGELKEKTLLCITFLVDHNLIDGAPIARFVARVGDLMKEATFLEDISKP
ncbi:MAG: 2-oxo acid dehydrogenase subunit E2 [Candidatus Heimdallarchaeaceae archaeon]